MEKNPILVLDDDKDELEMIKEAAVAIGLVRPILFFGSGMELISYLKTAAMPPFLIISDVNLPKQDGFEIRKQLSEDDTLKYKSVPFIFWSTAASEKQIKYAYDLPAQGFFAKPSNFDELCQTFNTMIEYWEKSLHPKPFN